MVDVLLVLLVFFMAITTAQVIKIDKTIKLPIAKHGAKKDNAAAEVIVNVRWNPERHQAQFVMDDRIYSTTELLQPALKVAKESLMKKVAGQKNPPRLIIRADRDTALGNIADLMNVSGEVGLTNISFSSTNKD